MTWFLVDDRLHAHPKALATSLAPARRLAELIAKRLDALDAPMTGADALAVLDRKARHGG